MLGCNNILEPDLGINQSSLMEGMTQRGCSSSWFPSCPDTVLSLQPLSSPSPCSPAEALPACCWHPEGCLPGTLKEDWSKRIMLTKYRISG